MFLASLDDTIRRYKELLATAGENRLQLPNENFDTGQPTRMGDYRLADETYAKLLERFDGHLNDVSDARCERTFSDSMAPPEVLLRTRPSRYSPRLRANSAN